MRLSLTVPEQHDLDDPRLELDVRKLGRALSELPMLDAAESLYRLTGYVEPLNEQKLDSALRYDLLNAVAPSAQAMFDIVSPDNLNWRRMTEHQQQQVIEGIERLGLALANGFKIVLKHWFAEAVPAGAPRRFAQVLRRTCRQLGNVLVHSCRCRRPLPPHVCFELHQLYRLGRHFGVLALSGAADPVHRAPSLAELYLTLMLLAAIRKRLQPADVPGAYRLLLAHAGYVRLNECSTGTSESDPVYAVELNADAAPRAGWQPRAVSGAADVCLIDARPLADGMLKRLAATTPRHREGCIERRLLDALYARP